MAKRRSIGQLILQQNLLLVLLFSFAAAIVWMGSSLLFTYNTSNLTTQDKINVAPLTPELDTKALEALSARTWWSPEELQSIPEVGDPEATMAPATPIPTASVSATPSPEILPPQTASASGN